MNVEVREEAHADAVAVRRVGELAFGRPDEARIVERLRARGSARLSLVAVLDHRLVGHALFSPVVIDGGDAIIEGAGLGPMAVLPHVQRSGVGSRLVVEGVRRLRAHGHPFVAVHGQPDYYPRFGFMPAHRHGVRCAVPDELLQMLVLDSDRMRGVAGTAYYCTEFAGLA